MVLSFSKDNFGKFHQELPLLQLFEGLKFGVFLYKNVKTFDDGISCFSRDSSFTIRYKFIVQLNVG